MTYNANVRTHEELYSALGRAKQRKQNCNHVISRTHHSPTTSATTTTPPGRLATTLILLAAQTATHPREKALLIDLYGLAIRFAAVIDKS